MKNKLGTDPEVFLKEVATDHFFPAIGLIGGSKKVPKPIGKDCFVQEDNVMAEFNVPATNEPTEMADSIAYALDEISKLVKPKYEIAIVGSAMFDKSLLLSDKAKESGCEPDMSAHTMDYRQPLDLSTINLRVAGGHIHVALKLQDPEDIFNFIKTMDVFVGVPSIIMDKDEDRRKLFGRAGTFRLKPYGLEYRSLSNFWIANEKLINWVYKNTEEAINNFTKLDDKTFSLAKEIMDSSNKDEAINFCKTRGITYEV